MSATIRHRALAITSSRARRGLASTLLASMAVVAMAVTAAGQSASPDVGAFALVTGESLSPGTYRSTSVGDTTFVVGDGWISSYDVPGGGFGLVRADAPGTFDVARFEGDVLAEGCEPGGATIAATPDALMGYIAGTAGIATATEPAPVAIGGLEGLSIDITTSEPAGCPGPALGWLVPTLGRFFILPDSASRIIALDAGDHVITIVVDAPIADAEAFMAAAQPIIDSLDFAAAPSASPAGGAAASPGSSSAP